ncbi:hypothetical protein [Microcoleus vaginatus]|uniref:hypothetical protein n=1 Tax=Microcoleus vaginatus TaxID=119532 RepID=UPI001F61CA71|nr:hypothetical protein D0A37_10345 [Microcoleus vaginatus HSN003]
MRKRCFRESGRKEVNYSIENLKSQIGRSHLRKFHQKCDRSVCCLTIMTLHPLNHREHRSIIQSKIANLKSVDRTCGSFTKNAIGQSAV